MTALSNNIEIAYGSYYVDSSFVTDLSQYELLQKMPQNSQGAFNPFEEAYISYEYGTEKTFILSVGCFDEHISEVTKSQQNKLFLRLYSTNNS